MAERLRSLASGVAMAGREAKVEDERHALPDWVEPSRKSAAHIELVILGALLLALVAYTPGRILWVFAGSCALESLWLLASLAKPRRAAPLA